MKHFNQQSNKQTESTHIERDHKSNKNTHAEAKATEQLAKPSIVITEAAIHNTEWNPRKIQYYRKDHKKSPGGILYQEPMNNIEPINQQSTNTKYQEGPKGYRESN